MQQIKIKKCDFMAGRSYCGFLKYKWKVKFFNGAMYYKQKNMNYWMPAGYPTSEAEKLIYRWWEKYIVDTKP